MNLFKIFLQGITVGSLAFLGACTVSGSDDEINLLGDNSVVDLADFDLITSNDQFNASWNALSDNEKEFEYCYEMLDLYYLFAHSDSLVPEGSPWYRPLQGRRAYLGQGSLHYKPVEPIPGKILDTYYMFKSLRDGYTSYIPPMFMTYDEFIEEFEARDTISDIGVNVKTVHISGAFDAIVVAQVFSGSAAEVSHLQVEDTIVSLRGQAVHNENDFFDLAEGTIGDRVAITIRRNQSGDAIEINDTLKIRAYLAPSVTYKVMDSVAVIRIHEFADTNTPSDEGTYGEFVEALKATQNTKATIIDLRGNPGGSETQCINISTEMLSMGSIIAVEYRPYDVNNPDEIADHQVIYGDTVRAKWDGLAKDRYLVFMADSGSGSCSEYTLAGVLANRHSPLVGATTYGKGVGYGITPTYLEGAALITVGISYDLNKKTYHLRGIAPDVPVSDTDAQLDSALAIAKEGKRVRTAGYGSEIRPWFYEALEKNAGRGIAKTIPKSKDLGRYKVLKKLTR